MARLKLWYTARCTSFVAAQHAPEGRRRTGEAGDAAHDAADETDGRVGEGTARLYRVGVAEKEHRRRVDEEDDADHEPEDRLVDVLEKDDTEGDAEEAGEHERQHPPEVEERRTAPIDRSCPSSEPKTIIGPASCGATTQAQMPLATSPKAKPERPCTNLPPPRRG